jgi:hypothetical protein
MTGRWPATYGHSIITSQPNTNSTNESRTTAFDICYPTEKTHVENSFKKHRATTRAEAAKLADSVGLLLPSGTDGQPPSITSS